jgi:hypothetical protein
MALQADDGTILSAKDPIVLGRDGEPLSAEVFGNQSSSVRIIQIKGGLVYFLFFLFSILLISLGTVFFGGFLIVLIGISLVRAFLRLIRF